jgi:hypothetical protein
MKRDRRWRSSTISRARIASAVGSYAGITVEGSGPILEEIVLAMMIVPRNLNCLEGARSTEITFNGTPYLGIITQQMTDEIIFGAQQNLELDSVRILHAFGLTDVAEVHFTNSFSGLVPTIMGSNRSSNK